MEQDLGKLFIGGISWDTDEDRLREYFKAYGEVVEAVIMRDRNTGRARGFGFIVFADPAAAERVVSEKHMIDGRSVEAKKAVPRDDQNIASRNNSSIQGSPGQGRTKKIFVGGLASSVTENDFKSYFEQFGNIMDVVVMYDHNTQRPRGFGFITYDAEEAVDRVLHKTFHELNGKTVEVKRAVPKEQSPSPIRSPLVGYNYGFARANSLLNSYAQGYNLGSLGGYGVRMDGRFSPVGSGRTGFSQFGSPAYGMGLNLETGLTSGFGAANFNNNLGYGRVMSPYFGTNTNRYNTPIGFSNGTSRGDSLIGSSSRNVWANGGMNMINSPGNGASVSSFGSGSGGFGVFGSNAASWGSPISNQVGGNNSGYNGGNTSGYNGGNTSGYNGGNTSGYNSGNIGLRSGENNFGLGTGGLGRNAPTGIPSNTSFSSTNGDYEGSYGEIYRNYGETWPSSNELGDSTSYGYGLGNSADAAPKDTDDYVGGYTIANR